MNIQRHYPGWPSAVALVAAVLASPSQAAPLTLVEALRLAEDNAPSLAAEQAKLQAASSAAIPAGELPDPQLRLGVQNYPVGGPERWSIDRDFMTMQTVGVMQEVPNRAKRQARVEVAAAAVERAAAEYRRPDGRWHAQRTLAVPARHPDGLSTDAPLIPPPSVS